MLYSPIETFIRVIKGKYKAKILIYLSRKHRRFSEIRRKFPHMSERILIKTLKELEKEGIVGKTITGSKPPLRVEYFITPYGTSVCPILKQMWYWGEVHETMEN
jgi:DNA-binding HxlR family transcriptional regulator